MDDETLTVERIKEMGFKFHHRATRMGYTRVADRGVPVPYEGRFGNGYVVPVGAHMKANGVKSSKYEDIDYYLK